MRRREFITLVSGAVAAWPVTAFGKAQRIAIFFASFPLTKMIEGSDDPLFKAFFSGLRRLGYVEGQSLVIERYSGEGRASHYADLARDMVNHNPDLILCNDNEAILDLKAATTTIPIVGIFSNPVEAGIVSSLARPGGNITGVSGNVDIEEWGKRYQLLRRVVPSLTRVAVLDTRRYRDGWEALMPELGRRWGVTFVGPPINSPINEAEYRRAFAADIQAGADGIVVTEEDVHVSNVKLIVELAEKSRLPAMYIYKLCVEAGGLISYGTDVSVWGYNIADIVGQILKGAKPSEIPVRQPTKFELAINLKTAKALGLTVPPELVATADEVIE